MSAKKLFPAGIPKAKRLLDLLLTLPGLVLISPILLIIAILVRWRLGSPVLFRSVYKFRTMTDTRNESGQLLTDKERLSKLGQFLRSFSLDELPELFNVLRGEMSLVGPRPLLVQYLERYSAEQARRHDVLPGMTGWAQVNGRNALTWGDKFRFDVWYVDHWSFGLDLKILGITLWKALTREGISQPGHATAEEFLGSGEQGD
jgi:sugar transferase EpsL